MSALLISAPRAAGPLAAQERASMLGSSYDRFPPNSGYFTVALSHTKTDERVNLAGISNQFMINCDLHKTLHNLWGKWSISGDQEFVRKSRRGNVRIESVVSLHSKCSSARSARSSRARGTISRKFRYLWLSCNDNWIFRNIAQ